MDSPLKCIIGKLLFAADILRGHVFSRPDYPVHCDGSKKCTVNQQSQYKAVDGCPPQGTVEFINDIQVMVLVVPIDNADTSLSIEKVLLK